MNIYTVYWKGGTTTAVAGQNIKEALYGSGYGADALRAIAFYDRGTEPAYEWVSYKRDWIKKEGR